MTQRLSAWAGMRATRREHWGDSFALNFFTLLGGLAPLWIGWLFAVATTKHPTLGDFAENGEFALYSAALIAPAFYIIGHQRTVTAFAGRLLFLSVSLTLILLSVVAYCLVVPVLGVKERGELDLNGYSGWTLVLFLGCILVSFTINALENARSEPAVREIVKEQQDDLEAQFDRLNKERRDRSDGK